MKRILIITTCALLLIAAGCKKKSGQEPQTLLSNHSRPDWQLTDDNDPTQSMTAVIQVDLNTCYTEELNGTEYTLSDKDLLAAFADDELLGLASPQDGLFYLYICAPTQEQSSPQNIRFRYYSDQLRNIFVSMETVPFFNNQLLGSPTLPFTPTFVIE